MSRKATKRFFLGLRIVVAVVVAAVAFVLWQLNRSLPPFAMNWLERKLSAGTFAYSFEKATFNPLVGITLSNARINLKRTISPPLVRVGELQLHWDVDFDNPVYTWVRSLRARDLVVTPFDDLPESTDGGEVDLAAIFRNISVTHDWAVTPRHVSIENASIFEIPCRFVDFDICVRDAKLDVSNLGITFDSPGFIEKVGGRASYDPKPGLTHVELAGSVTPDVIRSFALFLEADTAVEYFDDMSEIREPISVSGEINWTDSRDEEHPSRQDIRASVHGGDFVFRGCRVRRIKMGIQWIVDPEDGGESGKRLVISPIEADFTEGSADCRLVWYSRTHATDIEARSRLPVDEVAALIGVQVPDCLTNFIFASSPSAKASGRIYGGVGNGTDVLAGEISAPALSIYGFDFGNVSTSFSVKDFENLAMPDIRSTFLGGSVTGRVDLAFAPGSDDSFDAELFIDDCNSDAVLTELGIKENPSLGEVEAHVKLSGLLDSNRLDSFNGEATATFRDAEILRFPLFAGLTDFIGRNIAGVDLLLMQSDMDVNATVTNGLVSVERLSLDGNLFSLVAKGKARLDAEGVPVEGVAQLRFFHSRSLMGLLARLVTLPVSKFMEFRVYGPIHHASWNYIGIIDRIAEATFWPRSDATSVKPESATSHESAPVGKEESGK